eukprot:9995383-Karenia_brevis.AAC.1
MVWLDGSGLIKHDATRAARRRARLRRTAVLKAFEHTRGLQEYLCGDIFWRCEDLNFESYDEPPGQHEH